MGRFNDLPKEIVSAILTRLPTECVLDCKLVCKPWKDLVQHQSFSQIHLNRLNDSSDDSAGKLGFVLFSYDDEWLSEIYYTEYDENCHEPPFNRKTKMAVNFLNKGFSFIGSCNGLICFYRLIHTNSAPFCHYGPACIWNPITREYVILPDFEGNYTHTGFGYSLSTNEYKVVRIRCGIAQVYTLGSGSGWRDVEDIIDMSMRHVSQCAAHVNGALHWVDHVEGTILAFNLTDEKFSKIATPHFTQGGYHVGVLGGFLSLTFNRPISNSEIWLLKKNEDNSDFSWSKEFSVDSWIGLPFEFTKSGRIMCLWSYNIYIYDPKASFAKMDVSFGKRVAQQIRHKNTLVSLKVLGEKDAKTMESGERANTSQVTETSA